ncbi:11157_t:CDS:2, partial [Entrophospora sp. SA101]
PEIKNNKGHYNAKCNYCLKYFEVGYPNVLEKHLARECVECDEEINEELKNLISNAKLWLDDESDFYEVEPNYKIDKKNNFVLEEIIDLNNSIFTD